MRFADVVVAEVDRQRSLDRQHGVILGLAALSAVGPGAHITGSEQRRAVGGILKRALIHQHTAAIDSQGDDPEQRYGAQPEDDEHLPTLAAQTTQTNHHQYSTVMADVDTM
jgi:hypothetical protein